MSDALNGHQNLQRAVLNDAGAPPPKLRCHRRWVWPATTRIVSGRQAVATDPSVSRARSRVRLAVGVAVTISLVLSGCGQCQTDAAKRTATAFGQDVLGGNGAAACALPSSTGRAAQNTELPCYTTHATHSKQATQRVRGLQHRCGRNV